MDRWIISCCCNKKPWPGYERIYLGLLFWRVRINNDRKILQVAGTVAGTESWELTYGNKSTKLTENGSILDTFKSYHQWHSFSNKATSPKPPQTASPTGITYSNMGAHKWRPYPNPHDIWKEDSYYVGIQDEVWVVQQCLSHSRKGRNPIINLSTRLGYLISLILALESWKMPGRAANIHLCWNPKDTGSNTSEETPQQQSRWFTRNSEQSRQKGVPFFRVLLLWCHRFRISLPASNNLVKVIPYRNVSWFQI